MITITPALLGAIGERPLEASIAVPLAAAMTSQFPAHGITTPLRVAHLLAQASEETAGFTTMHEFGGAGYFSKYDGRADLGNTEPGDGFRFRGRGILMLTGRASYAAYGPLVGLDLLNNPDLAADPANAVLIGCTYWTKRGLNALADADDLRAITKRINGGLTGLTDRAIYLARAKRVLLPA